LAPINPALLLSLIDAESLYQGAPCGYFSFVPDGTIVKINHTLLSWLGYAETEVVSLLKMSDLLSTGGKLYYQMFYFPLLQMNGTVNEISFDICKKDGSRFPALLNSNTLKDTAGNLLAVNVAMTDISDRKKYESELLNAKKLAEAEKSKFEFVSDFIPEMIWTANADGEINYFNKRFADHFNFSSKDFTRGQLIESIYPDDRGESVRAWANAIKAGEGFHIQLRLLNKFGHYNWYKLKGLPYLDEHGHITRWLGSCLDINNHVMELEKKDEFISIASHELKTPITALKATLQIFDRLKETDLPAKYHRLVDQGNRSILKISTLVDELLNVNRINAGQLVLNKNEINLHSFLLECCQYVRAESKYNLVVEGDTELTVLADEHRIDQVVVNFVNNAIKYAPGSLDIKLMAIKEGNKIQVSVTDNGPGITPDKLPFLFDRYYRADHTGNQYSGLGLGLYICSEIIKKHGGKIGVNSEVGKGSTFWFTLPL